MSRRGSGRLCATLAGLLVACATGTASASGAELRPHEVCSLADVRTIDAPPEESRPRYPLRPLLARQGADVEVRIVYARDGAPVDQRVCAIDGSPDFAIAALRWAHAQKLRLPPGAVDAEPAKRVRAVRMRFDPQRELELRRAKPAGVYCPGYREIHYPDEAKRAGVEGVAGVRFKVGVDGSISDVSVFRPSGSPLLDAAVLRHIGALECDSGNPSGAEPVELEFEFALTEQERRIARMWQARTMDTRVRLVGSPAGDPCSYHMDYPAAAERLGLEGRAKVAFVMGADGSASNFRLLQSSGHAEIDTAVRAHVMTMYCLPAPGDRPVEVEYEFRLN
jgi:TonB family protein